MNKYSGIDEIPGGELCGLSISEPHFLEFPGCEEGYHRIITYDSIPNLIVGTKGAAKYAYAVEGGEAHFLSKGSVVPFPGGEFVQVGSKLFHLRTQSSITASRDISYSGNGVFQLTDSEFIKWDGRNFTKFEKKDKQQESTETNEVGSVEYETPKRDLRESDSYRAVLDELVQIHPDINTKAKAEEYIKGEFESSVPDSDIRRKIEEELDDGEIELLKS